MNLIEELKWRGMIHTMTPGLEEFLSIKKDITGYAGFDPTASSLHIGHLIPVMMLVHFQRYGYKPIALVGGATGMVGDPSGKSEERKLLSIDIVTYNLECLKKQLEKFLDFSTKKGAEIVNNYDWFKEFRFLDFLRDVGKHITVNYMVAKESVKNRWENGISFTEFTYQLLQGYDFYWLHKNKGCYIQMGGSDQWGNITTGVELVRRMIGGEVHGITCPLLTRSDGKKFGKTASGESVWLDPKLTSPYKFYQYWLNTTDEDAPKFLRMFSLVSKEEIESLEKEHANAPHKRIMQKILAEDITTRVHSKEDLQKAIEASDILFGQGTTESLKKMSEEDFLTIFDGVPQSNISKNELEKGIPLLTLLTERCGIFPSKGEVRRTIANGGLLLNKQRCTEPEQNITKDNLLQGKYLLFQKGKKNYFIVKAN